MEPIVWSHCPLESLTVADLSPSNSVDTAKHTEDNSLLLVRNAVKHTCIFSIHHFIINIHHSSPLLRKKNSKQRTTNLHEGLVQTGTVSLHHTIYMFLWHFGCGKVKAAGCRLCVLHSLSCYEDNKIKSIQTCQWETDIMSHKHSRMALQQETVISSRPRVMQRFFMMLSVIR